MEKLESWEIGNDVGGAVMVSWVSAHSPWQHGGWMDGKRLMSKVGAKQCNTMKLGSAPVVWKKFS